MKIVAMQKAGRCSNGFENDHGIVIHGVPDGWEFGHSKALCGSKPGRRSVGWVFPYQKNEITCTRCISKSSKITQIEGEPT